MPAQPVAGKEVAEIGCLGILPPEIDDGQIQQHRLKLSDTGAASRVVAMQLVHQLIDGSYLDAYFPSGVREALDEMSDGEVRTLEVTTLSDGILLLQKNSIADAYDEYVETESNRDMLLTGLKADEFADSVEAGAAALEGVSTNDAAFSTYKLSEFYTFTPSSTAA